MVGLLIVAHAPLASALREVALHTFPDAADRVHAFDVPADLPLEELQARAKEQLLQLPHTEVLVLSDVGGATPCNLACWLAEHPVSKSVRVVAGANVPMVWRALCYAHEPLDSVAERALSGGTQGARLLTPS